MAAPTPKQRAVTLSRQGFDDSVIGAILGIPADDVRSLLYDADPTVALLAPVVVEATDILLPEGGVSLVEDIGTVEVSAGQNFLMGLYVELVEDAGAPIFIVAAFTVDEPFDGTIGTAQTQSPDLVSASFGAFAVSNGSGWPGGKPEPVVSYTVRLSTIGDPLPADVTVAVARGVFLPV